MNTLLQFAAVLLLNHGHGEIKEMQPTAMYDEDGNITNKVSEAYWPPLNNANGQNNRWKAVGQLSRNGEPGCTVNFIQIPNCPKPKKPQVITNGHCTDRGGKYEVTFGLFADAKPEDTLKFSATKKYGSYFNRDFSVMELDTDYESLAKVIKPFEIANVPARSNTPLETAGISLDKLTKKQQVLRHGTCTPAGYNKTVLNERYLWDDEMAFTGCSLRGGASGSGLFSQGKLYGLLHAGASTDNEYENAPEPCITDTCTFENNKPKRELVNYGYDVTNLHLCYSNCELNTKLPGCLLPDEDSKIVFGGNGVAYSNTLKKKFDITSNFTKFQVKGCTSDPSCSCDKPDGYKLHEGNTISGEPFFADGKTYSAKPNEPHEVRFLCVRGQREDGSVDDIKNMVKLPLHLKSFKIQW